MTFFHDGFCQKELSEAVLIKQLRVAKTDSERVDLMIDFSARLGFRNSAKTIEYALKAIDLSKKINYLNGLLSAYETAGDAYWYAYSYDKSVDYYLRELKLADSLNIPSRRAKAYYNIGWIKCVQQGVYSERGKLINAYKVFEGLKDTTSLIRVSNALSAVYETYYQSHHSQMDSALFYYRKMIFLGENSTQKNNMVTIYGNYSTFLIQHKKFPEAKNYLLKSLSIAKARNDSFGYMNNINILANLYYHTDSLSKAKSIFKEFIPIMLQKDYKSNLQDAYNTLYLIYKKEKDFENALKYHVLFKEINDTLNSIVMRSNLQEKETAYEISKREENIKRLEQINEVSQLKNKQNTYIMAGLAMLALLIIGFAINLYRGNRNKQQANALLSEQNRIIAEKKSEIEQSIQYAKGIQNAILPAINDFKHELPGSFVVYLPKDVVSGDFYWMHISPPLVLMAAADCTGHGVPGSLMSIVSMDKLNQAVLGKKLVSPSQILSSINNDIKKALKQESTENTHKDGLDIALLQVDIGTRIIRYSGAHRPLWIIRRGQLIEFKATKTSIAGHTPYNQQFEEHQVSLEKDDLVLVFSDGYADQFGGEQGKKMMTRNFKNHLLAVADKTIPEIERSILDHFSGWKGRYEQVDDVLVIGFKI
ncbi:MAG: SpoIIE family protein phosphatase [Bacteroidia bacterium]